MYRTTVAIAVLTLVTTAVGCATKEIDADEKQKFSTVDPSTAQKGMEESMAKSGMKMRPEAMDQMKKMQESMSKGASKAGSEAPATP